MADKSFGVKELNLISASGTPTITSPNSVNINATNVAISTDITVGGMVSLGAGTSISSPGTNVLTFGTNSTEKVRITSDGNVGINDTAPSEKLNVGGNIMLEGSNQYLYLTNVGTGNAGIYVRGRDSTSELRSHSTGIFTWEVTGSEKMRITSGGQININASSESVGGRVVIKHNVDYTTTDFDDDPTLYLLNDDRTTGVSEAAVVFAGRNTSGSTFRAAISGNGSTGLKFYTTSNTESDETPAMMINGSGRLMIGTTTPGPSTADDLTIATSGHTGISLRSGTSSSGNIFFSDGTSGGDQTRGVIQYDHSSNFMRFYTDNAERMRITADGKFGIGTDNPTNRLHVYSSSNTGEIRLGGGNGSGNHRLFFQAHPSTAYIDSYGNNTHNPLSINADPLILNNSGSGKVLIATNTNNDNKAKLVVNGMTDCGNVITGRIHDSTNNNNRTVLLFRMNQSQGFQFSGDIIVNSWTGNAKVNCHITVQYQNQNVEVDVVNATHSSQISKTNLRVVTADYGSNRYLGIQKNGGGSGVFYINAFVTGNMESSGNGGIREVNNSSLGSVTNQANLN